MTFHLGDKPMHDVAAAGRKGKAASPWSRRMIRTRNSERCETEWLKRHPPQQNTQGDNDDGHRG